MTLDLDIRRTSRVPNLQTKSLFQLTIPFDFYTFAPMGKSKQLTFSQKSVRTEKSEHGGSIKGSRKRKRPVGVRSTMHLVLKSSQAKGTWSFGKHELKIREILQRFAGKNHIQILSAAYVGNHIHLHMRVKRRDLFRSFIRATSAAIMMKVTGYSRWNPSPEGFQFWDTRPFSRIVSSWTEFLNLKAYIEINQWEGIGYSKNIGRTLRRMGALTSGPG